MSAVYYSRLDKLLKKRKQSDACFFVLMTNEGEGYICKLRLLSGKFSPISLIFGILNEPIILEFEEMLE